MRQDKLFKHLSVQKAEQKYFTVLIRALYKGNFGILEGKLFFLNYDNLKLVENLWKFISWSVLIQSPNWTNTSHLEGFLEKLLTTPNKIIQPFIILCPTYKKDGTPGLNDKLGRTSKVGITNFLILISKLEEMLGNFYKIDPLCYFGTLAIEQYDKLDKEEWIKQIKNNLIMLEEELSKLDKRIKIIRTDDILELEEKIGYAGFIDKALIDRNKDRIKTIIDRNRAFYVAKMGWSTEDSDTRSNNSITTYNILGQYFSTNIINPVFLYTANSYEKAIAYNLENSPKLWILYPKKDENKSIIEFN